MAHQEHYITKELFILTIRKKYEKYNDILEKNCDINADEENFDSICDGSECDYLEQHVVKVSDIHEDAFYDPERPRKYGHHDIESEFGITAKYNTTVDFSGFRITDEYNKIMQSLNVKQNELCDYVIHWIQRREEPMLIFIEGNCN